VRRQGANLHDENHGGNEVKYEGAVPNIELSNLGPLQHNALAQIMCSDKGHIPADKQLKCKSHTCRRQSHQIRTLALKQIHEDPSHMTAFVVFSLKIRLDQQGTLYAK